MFKLFSDIYFVVYKLYYVSQNDDLDIRISLKNWDGGSTKSKYNKFYSQLVIRIKILFFI
jgi:hypothetical protein